MFLEQYPARLHIYPRRILLLRLIIPRRFGEYQHHLLPRLPSLCSLKKLKNLTLTLIRPHPHLSLL